MTIIKKAALYFARKEFCRNAINESVDLNIFKKKMTAPVFIGLFLIVFSYAIGIPAFFVVGIIAAKLRKPVLGVVGIPVIYGFSWLLLMLGMYLTGPEYARALGSRMVRFVLGKILGDELKTLICFPTDNLQNNIINKADRKR